MEDPILYNVCNTCGAVEHHDTEGIVSVYENLANKWFCSSYCLYQYKQAPKAVVLQTFSGDPPKNKKTKRRSKKKHV